ncbi:Cwf15/Cwc15 cell cycle control protein [Lactarius akahatsu]|uniref:Cwf15/Cwc15 cell cycle control protein n=1 Tax=Lactarius akahatsu TaxID=416441 RepID=A0AAD4QBV7_9AGAM|nr:Cwf15/Cwc15 cell cycle control protein [Lactarius akahatsu]
MSTAHRPTWDPAQAREGGSRQYSVRDMAAHTELKFRYTSVDEVKKRDLRADLLAAEAEARVKKRKAAGLPVEDAPVASEDAEAKRRRRGLQEALEMDKDADSDEGDGDGANDSKVNAECAMLLSLRVGADTHKQRRPWRKTVVKLRPPRPSGRHRLNLTAALGNAPGINTTAPGTFAVKRRWDNDPYPRIFSCRHGIYTFLDLVFKNQAIGQFANDLLRTEFHKKFMSRFIK